MANVLHSQATGIHPGAYHQPTAPASPIDGILWVDTSAGPPYQLTVWNQSAGAWQTVGIVTAAAGGAGGGLTLIQRQIVGAGGVATVTFSAIPQTYECLWLVGGQLHFSGSGHAAWYARCNGDSVGGHYDWFGTDGSSTGDSKARLGDVPGITGGITVQPGGTISVMLPGYSSGDTWHLLHNFAGYINSTSDGAANSCVGWWHSPVAITQLDLILSAGTWSPNSRFSLYGLA